MAVVTSVGRAACSDDHAVNISKDCEVRLRILGMNADQQKIFCIGTIKGEFLGLTREA